MNEPGGDSRLKNRTLLTVLFALGTGIGVFLGIWVLIYGLNFGPFSRADAWAVLTDFSVQLFSGNWDLDRGALIHAGDLPWFTLTLWIAGVPALLLTGASGKVAWKILETGTHYRGSRLVERSLEREAKPLMIERSELPERRGSSETASSPRFLKRIFLTVLCALAAGTGVFFGVWVLIYGRNIGPFLRADAGTFLRDFSFQLFFGNWDRDRGALIQAGTLPWFTLTLWVAALPALLGAGAAGRGVWKALETGTPSWVARLVSLTRKGKAKDRTTELAGLPKKPESSETAPPDGKDASPPLLPFAIAGVTTAPDLPCSHLLIGATTGAGKSQVLQNGVLDRILEGCDRRPGQEKALIIDSGGEFLKTRGTARDLILNPYDRRSQNWNPFEEIRQESDYDLVANAVLPDAPSASQPEWIGMGRDFLVDIMKSQVKNMTTKATPAETFRLVVSAEIDELGEILAGTTSEVLIKSTSNERLLANIRYEASRVMKSWQLLKTGGDFSIRQWIREGTGILFITYRESEVDTLKNLIGAWLSLAIRETLSLPADFDRRMWFVADELDSLGQVNSLDSALARGRKYGLSMIATIQSVAQLERTYGHDTARVLLSVFASKLAMRQGAAYDAEHWSKEIGEQEVWRSSRSQNTGASGGSSGTTESLHNVRLVLPAELMDLPRFSGFMRLADRPGIQRFTIPFRKVSDRFPAFVPVGTEDACEEGTGDKSGPLKGEEENTGTSSLTRKG